jgi:hypothetical protein
MGRPCSPETRAKISAAMRGNKNGRPHRKTVSARVLNSLRSMDEGRATRLHRFLAENPEADAARKAKIAAGVRAHHQRLREEKAREAQSGTFRDLWASLSGPQRRAMIQNWHAPHDASGRKITTEWEA